MAKHKVEHCQSAPTDRAALFGGSLGGNVVEYGVSEPTDCHNLRASWSASPYNRRWEFTPCRWEGQNDSPWAALSPHLVWGTIMESLAGNLLIASPKLPDPNFYHAVVLMIQHDDDGAFGLILNRPSDRTVAEVLEPLGLPECAVDAPLRVGGPVGGPLMAVHADAAESEEEVIPGVHFSASRESLESLITEGSDPMLVFAGYSGWGGGQLDNEWEMGGWLSAPATYETIFWDLLEENSSRDHWKAVTEQIGQDVLGGALRLDFGGGDPSLN